MGPQKSA